MAKGIKRKEKEPADEGNDELISDVTLATIKPKQKKTKLAAASERTDVALEASPSGQNKEKVLMLASRGITHRYRHLLGDLCEMLPHTKKEAKLDTKDDRSVINEVAELKGCSSCVYFETRKHKDLYIWFSKTPSGPSVKFHVLNVHTLAELKLTGNHLKGSRAVLSFDATFDQSPHLQVMKEVLAQTFAIPRGHRKSKPFVDHTMSFTVADGRIWIRNYQIVLPSNKKGVQALEGMNLVEVGPRLCLNPIRVFAGSFRGQVLYDNPTYVSPNTLRAEEKRKSSSKYAIKVKRKSKRAAHLEKFQREAGELDDAFDE
eukprot:CAMPEP_0196584520 /NCGR_PEP_ID=MMETSP1081-20130531/47356_1 /TAXON_ID=36882 /ORGANISM="Pyramimonas amylifera, Strain CCMP720" /LENGTH=316 /DNA_ID=CAMNT_0041905751 /DNA_START=49 /DNA_END=999 /DNA_ORIENTATION=+